MLSTWTSIKNCCLIKNQVKIFSNHKYPKMVVYFVPGNNVENTVEKGENAGYQHFLSAFKRLCSQCRY